MSRTGRLLRIARTAQKYRLDTLIDVAGINPRALPVAARIAWAMRPSRFLPAPKTTDAVRLRLALETLGPVFIKFGQILSTRKDILSEPFAEELAKLQDQVPPFPNETARALVESELGKSVDDSFARFDAAPLATAPLAQVHGAQLHDATEVVVKIIRPDVEPVIGEDIAVMRLVARILERASSDARRMHLVTVVEDYARTIFAELDLAREGGNTAQLRRNFAESPLLYVPRVYWDFTTRNVLVLERIYGIPIARTDLLHERGTNMKVLAERGVETFFTQVFVHNFFHADMHPGNIFVDVDDPENPRYIAVDCAIIGNLTEEDQNYLAQNLLAFFYQDYRRVAQLHLESGWVPPGTDVHEFESVIREVCEPIFARPLKEILFGHFLVSLFRAARQFDMEVQPQLVLLQKTLINIEGLGRQLYPDLDLWETAKPFMEQWMRERMGPLAAIRRLAEHGPELLEQLPRLPELLINVSRNLERLDRLTAEQTALKRDLDRRAHGGADGFRSRIVDLGGGALVMVSSVLIYLGYQGSLSATAGVVQWPELTAGVLGAVLGFVLIYRKR